MKARSLPAPIAADTDPRESGTLRHVPISVRPIARGESGFDQQMRSLARWCDAGPETAVADTTLHPRIACVLEDVWTATHADYRAEIAGQRAILVRRPGGLTWVPLAELTAFEVRSRKC